MINFFRSIINSRIGVGLTLVFVALIALAFAGSSVLDSGPGSTNEGATVASSGSRKISGNALDFFARRRLQQVREKDPNATLRSMIAAGGLDVVLGELVDNASITEFGKKVGIVSGERLIGSELAKESAFRGLSGTFDENTYRAALAQQGFKDKDYRQLVADVLVSQQVQIPASFGAKVPAEFVTRYASLITETREGSIALIPAAVFAPKTEPTAQELAKYYTTHQTAYARPERRTVRYISFDDSALKNAPLPSDKEIAAKYEADKAKYAPSETRKLSQLVLPTEAAAKVVIGELAKGMSLQQSATSKKLATAEIAAITKEAYAAQNSAAAADAVFAAAQGKIAGPVKGGLGWYVVKVEGVTRNPGKTLDQARKEISDALSVVKKRAAFADFSAKIEDEFDQGGSLSDVAKELGAEIKQTEPLTADGKVFGKPELTAPPELARVIQTAFLMDKEGQAQLAEVVPGKTFLAFTVGQIEPGAPAPIAEIRAQVIADYQLEKGAAAAQIAANKVAAAGRKTGDLTAAMASLGMALPPVDQVSMKRMELQRYGRATPPPLKLLFAMAKGTVKLLPGPNNRGWYIIALKNITPGAIDPKDPGLVQAAREMAGLAGQEYAEQLRSAILAEVGAKTDKAAVTALAKQLTGTGSN
jgi:peptidyl-prolyl cis-trans isomerase D